MWVKQQEAQGIILVVPLGRRGKAVDANDPLIRRYIENTLRKLQYQAEKLRLQNIASRKKYVTRDAAFEFFAKLLELEKEFYKVGLYPIRRTAPLPSQTLWGCLSAWGWKRTARGTSRRKPRRRPGNGKAKAGTFRRRVVD